jgi:hypothetical protein
VIVGDPPPDDTPVTIPVASTVALPVLLLAHVPPAGVGVSVTVVPTQTVVEVVVTTGVGFTLIVMEALAVGTVAHPRLVVIVLLTISPLTSVLVV